MALFDANEKFGKVYLTSKFKPAVLHCLEDAKFSIVDFKWYTATGEEHPAYEKYKNSHFRYQFTIRNKDSKVNEVVVTGQLGSCFSLDGMPAIKLADLEDAEATGLSWSVLMGMVSKHDDKKMTRFRNTRCGYISTGITPSFTIEQRKIVTMFMCTLFTFDDWLLDLGHVPFRKLQEITKTIADVLRGSASWQEENGKIAVGLSPYLRAFQGLREEALKYSTEQNAYHMIEALCEHVLCFAVERCTEWNELQSTELVVFRNAQPSLRHINMGFQCLLETVMVPTGIVLDKSVRQCFLFQHFCKLCEQHTCKVNDMMSFQKEMNDKETCNHVIILHVMEGLPLEEAVERTFHEIDSITYQIVKLGDMLEKIFAENPEVARAVDTAKQMLQGHYFYFPFAPRYGHDLTYDCVVESE